MKNLFDPFPNLSSNRLWLRETIAHDADEVLFLRSDPATLRYLSKKPMESRAEALAFVENLASQRRAGQSIEWCIAQKPATKMIGSICLWNFSADYRKGEVGYLLHPAHHGAGLMSEAMTLVLEYGFNVLRLERIEAFTHRENHRSLRLLVRHGFTAEEGRHDPEDPDNQIFSVKRADLSRI